ncbi:MAG: hypothetical protein UY09_C0012G0018 [Parcubacteria group bacterium GW2011_GWA2_47_8]|nr:MAG: hypothetical protein UY09_C0012G0018 [Parcubacteria group bacterium GW2011_GWA2_47_8]OHB18761.1 MAG: hypothetical protein A2666_02405 [Parcubacteria group bacterium RIFCSPHIGHO2_01_FULL_47_10b]
MQDLNSLLAKRARSILSSEGSNNTKALSAGETIVAEVLHGEGYDTVKLQFVASKTRQAGVLAPNAYVAQDIRLRAQELITKINRRAGRVIVTQILVRIV